jgi:hypothetical protein
MPAYDVEEQQEAPEAAEAIAAFLTRYREILTDLYTQSVPHIPGNNAENDLGYTVRLNQIPESSPGVPNFSGYSIGRDEPIIYLVGHTHDSNQRGPRRRATMQMLEDILEGNFRNVPADQVRQLRTGMRRRTFTEGGIACIPWHQTGITDEFRYAPVCAEVFCTLTPQTASGIFPNLTLPQMARNWSDIVANFTAKASFHEIAHCKCESYNRPTGAAPRWSSGVLGRSIHDVQNNGIFGATVAYSTSPTDADFETMGNHMLCPMPFYKLDEPIAPQFWNRGSAHTVTAEARETFEMDEFDI